MYAEVCDHLLELVKRATDGDGKPLCSIGGSTVQRDRECVVREVPENVSIDTSSTSVMGRTGARGCYRIVFSVGIELWAKTRGLEEASALVTGWFERICSEVAADKTLGGLVVKAEPYYSQGGSAADNNKALYTVAIDMGVRVKADIVPVKDETKEQ